MSHHDLPGATARGVQLVVRLYPWSVLWVLFAIGLILVIHGGWAALSIIVALILTIAWHSVHEDHRERRGGRR